MYIFLFSLPLLLFWLQSLLPTQIIPLPPWYLHFMPSRSLLKDCLHKLYTFSFHTLLTCPTVSLQPFSLQPFNHFVLLSLNSLHVVCFLLIKRQQRQDSRCNFSRFAQENDVTHPLHTVQSLRHLGCHIALKMRMWVAAHWYPYCNAYYWVDCKSKPQ